MELACLPFLQLDHPGESPALEDEASTADWGKCLCGDLEMRLDRVGVWSFEP